MSVDPSISRIEALAKQLDAWGCTAEQIDAVRLDQGVAMPRSYEAYLRCFGRDGGGLFGGTEVCFPGVLGLRQAAIALLAENAVVSSDGAGFDLPDDAFVISMHQGYWFEFLRTSLGDDPPVEYWSENLDLPGEPVVWASSIADWLEAEAASSVLPPAQRETSRVETQTIRRRVSFLHERCPSCGGELRWSTWTQTTNDATNPVRTRLVADCTIESRTFWRWADQANQPLAAM